MRYLLRRLGFFVLTLWAALTINFLIPRLIPGSPATAILARFHGKPLDLGAARPSRRRWASTTTQNIFIQYFKYLGNTLTLNFGDSVLTLQPVSQDGRERDPVDARP